MAYQFSSDPLFVREGDVIQFKYKAPDTWDTTETVTIQVGLLTQFWFITTIPEDFQPDPFPLQPVANADLDTVYTYGDGTRPGENIIVVSGLTPTTVVPISVSANDFPDINRYSVSINGGAFVLLPENTTVQNGDTIQLRARTFDAASQTVRVNLTIGLAQESWELTTKQTPINKPNPAPVFTPLTGLPLNSPVYSNIVVVQGLTGPGQVSAGFGTLVAVSNTNTTQTNAEGYDVLSGVTFASSATISNGKYLQLLATSPINPNTQLPIAVDIAEGISISTWQIETGAALSTTPNNFSFPNITNVAPGVVVQSQTRPVGGIGGLSAGVVVPVELVSTSGTEPRIRINDGSIGVFPTTVQNGDVITLYNKSSTTFGGNVETAIKVGTRIITTWSIDTYLTPDSTPSFTAPPNLTNRVPDTFISSAIVGLTDFNVPITITATNGALISIDYDTPVAGPRTFDPLINQLIFLVLKTQNALSASSSTTVTIGDATPFTWTVSTYAVAPPPPSNLGTWYSIKTKKYDGLSIGTVVQVLKENVVDEYGDIEERFPGFLECDGSSYPVAQYSDLWNIIGNTYGGTGDYDETTFTYSGTFNVPDYRNKKICGIGALDSNFGGSPFLPVDSGSINQVGSTGGYWYIDRSGIAGPLPLEQVYTGGTESPFFSLGTVKTIGTEQLTGELSFNITGSINAILGPIGETTVNVPTHEHVFWSSAVESDGGEPAIPWDTRAFYNFGGAGPGQETETVNAFRGPVADSEGIQTAIDLIRQIGGSGFVEEVTNTGLNIDDLVPIDSSEDIKFGNWWASPLSTLQGLASDRLYDTGVQAATDSGVIDTQSSTMKISPYASPGTLKTHSHLMSLDAATNPQTDFTYGNVNSVGTKYAGSLPTANTSLEVSFNQSELLLELNPASFTFNSSIKPIPVVELQPTKTVPLVTPFHKVKYIIKAY
jgi:hypothetical protein